MYTFVFQFRITSVCRADALLQIFGSTHLLCFTAIDVIHNIKATPTNLAPESIILVAISLNMLDGPATRKPMAPLPVTYDVDRVSWLRLWQHALMERRP
jgi:hypothetical protein